MVKHKFELSGFPYSEFEIETSVWTGKSTLYMDNVEVKKSLTKGKPFELLKPDGTLVFAYPKKSFPDFIPKLEINGELNNVVEPLEWYEYVVGGLPIILMFIGGLIGGVIGVLACLANFNIFREEKSSVIKYLKVFAITIVSFIGYFLGLTIFTLLVQ